MAEDSFSPEIQQRIDALPASAREFVTSPDMGKAVQGIGLKHRLHVDQVGALEAEVLAAIIGISDLEDFPENLTDVLSTDTQKSDAIAKDVNDLIFVKIREDMKASSTKPEAAQTQSVPPAAQTTPLAPIQTHEVIMPSSTKPVALSTPTPITTPVAAPTPPSTLAPAPKPATAPNLGAADAILSEKKVTPPAAAPTPAAPATLATPAASPMPKVDPAQPQNYKADPYREPVE